MNQPHSLSEQFTTTRRRGTHALRITENLQHYKALSKLKAEVISRTFALASVAAAMRNKLFTVVRHQNLTIVVKKCHSNVKYRLTFYEIFSRLSSLVDSRPTSEQRGIEGKLLCPDVFKAPSQQWIFL